MHTLRELKEMLETRGLAPRKSLGQNFLIDKNLVRKLVDASGVQAGDRVLEVGPGAGALTEALLERGCDVVACELDDGLAELMQERFGDRITLIRGDCLASKHALHPEIVRAMGDGPYRLIANLPYNAASPLMATLLADHPNCLGQYVTIQKEVGERLMAKPGTKAYGPLTVIVQALAKVERIATLPPECFWPRPGVTSVMLALVRRDDPLTDAPAALSAMCHTLFSKRRKTLGAILGRAAMLPEGVTHEQRPETLTPEQIVELARSAAVRDGAA
ncbi:MAG: ribosomal RNA small subunit methyltransferase A [Phycisphaerales bacterium]|nr:MAG: ribosomal RNA small subunit methyltransferase A [Phycisphaerales bacterium]